MALVCDPMVRAPLMIVMVGKWWGLFRVPSPAPSKKEKRRMDTEEPEVLSWHATEAEASKASSDLIIYDPTLRRSNLEGSPGNGCPVGPLR